MKRNLTAILILLGILAAGLQGAGNDPLNIDVFFGWGGCYRPMEWTPLEIGISGKNLSKPLAAILTVSAQQDSLNNMNISHQFVLVPDLPLQIPLVTKLAFEANECIFTVTDSRGKRIQTETYNLWDFSSQNNYLTPLSENELLLGLVGAGRFGLLQLPKHAVCSKLQQANSYGPLGSVYLQPKVPRMVPWDWTGFVSLDALILYDPDWSLLREDQIRAIMDWVSNGGKLLLVLGRHQLTNINPIKNILPVNIGPARQTTIAPALLSRWKLVTDMQETVTAYSLSARKPDSIIHIAKNNYNQILFAVGNIEFGSVGVLGFDPAEFSHWQQSHSGRFWVHLLKQLLQNGQVQNTIPITSFSNNEWSYNLNDGLLIKRSIEYADNPQETREDQVQNTSMFQANRQRYRINLAQAGSNAVLEQFYGETEPLSIWWVVILLVAMMLLIGPIDYLVLKRLGHLPMTWVTCAFWITVLTIGAYYGVQFLRSGDLKLKVIRLDDHVAGSNHTWSTTYSSIFAPRSDNYQLEIRDKNRQWWSAISPNREYLYQFERKSSGKSIYCLQHDGSNIPLSLPINIWDWQCLLQESICKQFPFNAEFERDQDRIILKITNAADYPIRKGYILVGENYQFTFKRVAAGASCTFSGQMTKVNNYWKAYLDRISFSNHNQNIPDNVSKEAIYFAEGTLPRSLAIMNYCKQGAAVVCVEFEQASVGFALKDKDYNTEILKLARLVILPGDKGIPR